MTEKLSVALIGAGSMGGSLLKGWLANDILDTARSFVFDPGVSPELEARCNDHGIICNGPLDAVTPDYLFLAIKPQIAKTVLPDFASVAASVVTISVMAGASIETIRSMLGENVSVVRAMPNLPSAVGAGMTGIFAEASIPQKQRQHVCKLFETVGNAVEVSSETEIDYVTAISGSGPAYYFLFTEALERAACELGLDTETCKSLARATLIGAGEMAKQEERAVADMRAAVTSPGGTTHAALSEFQRNDALIELVEKAVFAAAKRAGELAS